MNLPETFEVARYHSLHGIKDQLPDELAVTALSEDGIVMGIQHKELPFAAVQFHPESILTSPAHGMTILENALRFLRYEDDDKGISRTGAEIVGELEVLSPEELKAKLDCVGLSSSGSKSELVVRLALWTHKRAEVEANRLVLSSLRLEELEDLSKGLGFNKRMESKSELAAALESCLLA